MKTMLCFLACLTTSPLLADYTYLWSGNDPRFTGRFSISDSDFVNREFINLTAVNFQFHDSQDPSHDVILDSFLDVPPGGSGNEFGFLTSDGQHLDHSKTNAFSPSVSFWVAAWQHPYIDVGLYSWNLFGDSVEHFKYANYTDQFFVETTGSWLLQEIAPTIQSLPLTQTVEVGTPVDLSVRATGSSPMFYLWYLNNTNLISSSTNRYLELANLQLEEFRVMDRRLDMYLDRAYDDLERRRPPLFGQATRTLQHLRRFRVDVAKLTDEVTHITKFFGDWYLARIYLGARDRFYLDEWRASVEQRLAQLDKLYSVVHAEVNERRMLWLEMIIVIFFALDLVILLWAGR